MGRNVLGKLGTMRKEVEWTVYPLRAGEPVQIQSDKRIARVNLDTGVAVLPVKGNNNLAFMNRTSFELVPEDMLAAIKAVVAQDDGSGVINLLG